MGLFTAPSTLNQKHLQLQCQKATQQERKSIKTGFISCLNAFGLKWFSRKTLTVRGYHSTVFQPQTITKYIYVDSSAKKLRKCIRAWDTFFRFGATSPLKNAQFCSSTRKTKILTAEIH